MEGVGIFSGDVLLIEKICQVHNKDIIYVSVDGEWLIKTYYMDDYGRHWLVPSNPKYNPMLLTEDMEIYIGGRVKYNLTLHHEKRENIMDSISKFLQKESESKPEPPRMPTQEEVEEALAYAGEKMTVTEMLKDERLSGYTNQKISALLRQMTEAKTVVKTIEGKKSYFEVAVE
jgi:hypothetical protein